MVWCPSPPSKKKKKKKWKSEFRSWMIIWRIFESFGWLDPIYVHFIESCVFLTRTYERNPYFMKLKAFEKRKEPPWPLKYKLFTGNKQKLKILKNTDLIHHSIEVNLLKYTYICNWFRITNSHRILTLVASIFQVWSLYNSKKIYWTTPTSFEVFWQTKLKSFFKSKNRLCL